VKFLSRGTQHPLWPENPLEIIDFIDPEIEPLLPRGKGFNIFFLNLRGEILRP